MPTRVPRLLAALPAGYVNGTHIVLQAIARRRPASVHATWR